jgi:hypothetical protein
MQFDKANSLRESWGNKPCSHPHLEKEYYLSSDTTDYVCTTCGETFTRAEKEKIESDRKQNFK